MLNIAGVPLKQPETNMKSDKYPCFVKQNQDKDQNKTLPLNKKLDFCQIENTHLT